MSQTVTLHLQDSFYEPIKRIAQAMAQPIESVLLKALQTSLPPLDGLSDEQIAELTQLETLDNTALKQLLLKTVPKEQQQALETLLQKNQAGILNVQVFKIITTRIAYKRKGFTTNRYGALNFHHFFILTKVLSHTHNSFIYEKGNTHKGER